MRKKLIAYWNNLIGLDSSPHEIALGFSIGSFIAVFPTPGFGLLLGFLALLIHPKMNKLSLFMAFVLFNPLVLAPLYALNYQIGDLFLGEVPVTEVSISVAQTVFNYTIRLIVGSLVFGGIFGVLSYFMLRYFVTVKQRK